MTTSFRSILENTNLSTIINNLWISLEKNFRSMMGILIPF